MDDGCVDADLVIVGGGQAGLAVAYYARRAGLRLVVLDAEGCPGGAWQHMWDSLRLFSPASSSAMPGWPMPEGSEDPPGRGHVVDYLTRYEDRYGFDVRRPVRVTAVERCGPDRTRLLVRSDTGEQAAPAVVSATGTWRRPFWPTYPGQAAFRGRQLHVSAYKAPTPYVGRRVLVVGGGNSGAQVMAELAPVATATWVVPREPRFLPDDVDGRALFAAASRRRAAILRGEAVDGGIAGVGGLGDVVVVPTVRAARDAGLLRTSPPFRAFTSEGVVWRDGRSEPIDAVIWCTGFRPVLDHLRPLRIRHEGRVDVAGTRSVDVPGLWLVGYGDWTGPGSATLAGVGPTARDTVREVVAALGRTAP
ncbi:MAG TPA: ArsO family NAD(P)H-dependent flavin-containing monooxygenase [Jiangellales bacterium]|nr:ArsO family NAD(P)H-dependent flavin-containing monooxygenase [Jiangellales bacterium]